MNLTHEKYTLEIELREKARSIANFKMHFTIFILANFLIWLVSVLLYFTFQLTWLWAFFPSSMWSIILIFHYFWVFKWNKDMVDKEYNKLLKKIENKNLDTKITFEEKSTETNEVV